MFGLFKKKSPTMMDAFIRTIYGANPPSKSADLERSITIAHEDLLFERVPLSQVKRTASGLFKGPIPYSTHDLAVSTALAFFKSPEYVPALQECQMPARLRVANWVKDGKVVKPLAQNFEEVLYRVYKPQPPEAPGENRFRSEPISRKSEQNDIPRKTDSLPKIRKPAEASQNSSPQPQTESPPSPWAGSNASLKPHPTAAEIGRRLAIILLDPDDCWCDVCKLRKYDAPGPVATCEMAFARAAVIKDTITRCQPDVVATQMLAGVDQFVAEAFAKEETTAEVLEYYKGTPLAVVAPQTIQLYQENVFWLPELADVFARRLKVPGLPVVEIAPLFEEVVAKAKRLMKGSSTPQKLAANGESLIRDENPPSREGLVQPDSEASPTEGRTVMQLQEFFASFTPRPRSYVWEQDAMMTYAKERVRSRRSSPTSAQDPADNLLDDLPEALFEMSSPSFKEEWIAYNLSVAGQAVLKVKDKAEELLKHHSAAGLRGGDLAAEQIRPEIKRRSADLYYAELTDNLKWFPIEPSVMCEIAQRMTNEPVHPDVETPIFLDENRHRSRHSPQSFLHNDLDHVDPLSMQAVVSAVSDFKRLVDPFDRGDRNGLFHQFIIDPMNEALDKERTLRHSAQDLVRCYKQLKSLDDPVRDLRELTDFRTGRPYYFRRKDLIAIALNVGDYGENSNFQTLTDGYKWRADDVVTTLDQTLSEKEWEFVAEVYKLYAELLSQSGELYHRISGVEFELRGIYERKVKARHFNITVGGYYPQMYDLSRCNPKRVSRIGAIRTVYWDAGFKGDKLIRINFDLILPTIAAQAHDLAFREAIIQTMKIIPELKGIICERFGTGYYDDILRAANGVRFCGDVDSANWDHLNNSERDAALGH